MNEEIGIGELLLAGGGDAGDSWPIDERLVEQVGDDATIGYIPVAMPPEKYPDCKEWITSTFERHGLTDIKMWTTLTAVDAENLAEVSAVYIGGGNTYRLLDNLRETGLDRLIRQFVSDGGILYGGSAGAIICGETIETTPDENRVGITDSAGLGLLPNIDVWCHYEVDVGAHEFATTSGRTVLALPERSGVSITANRCKVVGYEPITVFQKEKETEYFPTEQFQL